MTVIVYVYISGRINANFININNLIFVPYLITLPTLESCMHNVIDDASARAFSFHTC